MSNGSARHRRPVGQSEYYARLRKESLARRRAERKAKRRDELLRRLRKECSAAMRNRRIFDWEEAPLLYELAQRARLARGRSVTFKGVRFPLRWGLFAVSVRDPDYPDRGLVAIPD